MIDALALNELDEAVRIEHPGDREEAVRAWKGRWLDACYVDYAVSEELLAMETNAEAPVRARALEKLGRGVAAREDVIREVETVQDRVLWRRAHVLVLRAKPRG